MRRIELGQELELDDGFYLVVEVAGGCVKLRSLSSGGYCTVHVSELSLRLKDPVVRSKAQPRLLDSISPAVKDELALFAAHLAEMDRGIPMDDPSGNSRSEYDPRLTSLNQRIAAKSSELKGLGFSASPATLKRKLSTFRSHGVAGLVDSRSTRAADPFGNADSRVLECLRTVIAERTDASTVTVRRTIELLHQKLLEVHPGETIPLPSDTTVYRYIRYLTKGKHTHGSAKSRRTAANTPNRSFRAARRMRPGEEVQIDSSPWDLLVLDGEGHVRRAVLTIMVDVATRSIIASGVRIVGTKGFDHAVLLARCLVPRQLRPGHEELWRLTARQMPWVDLASEDQRRHLDTCRPYIVPERIMMDNGADFKSSVFESACIQYGIDITYSSPHTPTDKAIVERTFHSIKTLFAQALPGFKGGSVAERGNKVDRDGLLDVFTLTELFDEWVVRVWQNRPHGGLTDPMFPRTTLTPNEMYDAMFGITGFLPVPFTSDDYIELMPVRRKIIQSDGITHDYRIYDSPKLQPFRGMPSPGPGHSLKWEYRFNPYDPRAIWVRHPDEGVWIECLWREDQTYEQPHAPETILAARRFAAERGEENDAYLQAAYQELIARSKSAVTKAAAKRARNDAAERLAGMEGLPRPAGAPERPRRQNSAPPTGRSDQKPRITEMEVFDDSEGD